MKKFLLTIICIIALIHASLAQENQPPHVTVSGTATTEVVPDEMLWSLRVQTRGLKLNAVAEEHSQTVQSILAFLKTSKLPEKSIQTSSQQFGENWEYKRNERVREGYIATTSISFKLKDFDLYKKLWLGLSEMPAVSVESVEFDHSKRIAYQNDTRRKAIQAAKEKAVALAEAIGSEVGEPLSIEEEQMEHMPMPMAAMAKNARSVVADGAESGDVMAPGTIPIKARVQASFRLLTIRK